MTKKNSISTFIVYLFLGCIIFAANVCKGQNLVPNGNFEQYSGCPDDDSQLDSALFWINPSTWAIGVGGTPDYYNLCASAASGVGVPNNDFGFQQAHSGNGYAGILTWTPGGNNYREYIEVPLVSTLTGNGCYHFEMYINLGDIVKYTSDNIAAYFSDTAIVNINNWLPLPFTPQINNTAGNTPDTMSWTLIEANYTATGTEKYLIIGNFNDDANTDTILYNNNGPPWANTVYFYIDDVSLSLCTDINEYNSSEIIVYPNPVIDKLNIQGSNQPSQIVIYDITLRKLLQQEFVNSISINTQDFAKGIYVYEVRNKERVLRKGKIIKE